MAVGAIRGCVAGLPRRGTGGGADLRCAGACATQSASALGGIARRAIDEVDRLGAIQTDCVSAAGAVEITGYAMLPVGATVMIGRDTALKARAFVGVARAAARHAERHHEEHGERGGGTEQRHLADRANSAPSRKYALSALHSCAGRDIHVLLLRIPIGGHHRRRVEASLRSPPGARRRRRARRRGTGRGAASRPRRSRIPSSGRSGRPCRDRDIPRSPGNGNCPRNS